MATGFILDDILAATKGRLIGKASKREYKGISIDSRTIGPGEIFLALKGTRFDGHDYIGEALSRGVSSVVVESSEAVEASGINTGSVSVVVVKDSLRALGDLAASLRERYPLPLIAVSGSTGKTTTKDMASLILGAEGKEVLKTKGNKNNLIGLPLTLLDLDSSYDFAVVELGISVAGEMERLAGISKPDVALLTNIGCGHIETLGDIEGVAMEKGELYGSLSDDGIKVVNIDDPWIVRLADMDDERRGRACDRITYSIEENADVSVSEVTEFGLDGTRVVYDVLGEDIEVRFNSPSLVNIQNGAAAIAGVLPLAAKPEAMRRGLNSFMPESHRMVVLNANSITILDDTYNANPESMAAAIATLDRIEGRKVAVLGDMYELGEFSGQAHFDLGSRLAASGVFVVVAVGKWAEEVRAGAVSNGFDDERFFSFEDKSEAVELLMSILNKEDTVLVKGSRGAVMEEVVFALSGVTGQS